MNRKEFVTVHSPRALSGSRAAETPADVVCTPIHSQPLILFVLQPYQGRCQKCKGCRGAEAAGSLPPLPHRGTPKMGSGWQPGQDISSSLPASPHHTLGLGETAHRLDQQPHQKPGAPCLALCSSSPMLLGEHRETQER